VCFIVAVVVAWLSESLQEELSTNKTAAALTC
jgi:hypothetical protein